MKEEDKYILKKQRNHELPIGKPMGIKPKENKKSVLNS